MKFAFWVLSVLFVNGIEISKPSQEKYELSADEKSSKDEILLDVNKGITDKKEILTQSVPVQVSDNFYKNPYGSIDEKAAAISQKFVKNYPKDNEETPIPCRRVYNPVCASFAEVKSTFINECLVNAENIKTGKNWKIFSQGICAEDFSKRLPTNLKRSEMTSNPKTQTNHNIESDFNLGNDVEYINAPPRFQTQFIRPQNSADIIPKTVKVENTFVGQQNAYSSPQSIDHSQKTLNQALNEILKKIENRQTSQYPIKPIPQSNNYEFSPINSALQPNYPFSNNNHLISSSGCNLGNTPLCAQYGWYTRTFEDVCKLKWHNKITGQNWQIAHDGECRNCVLDCPKIFDPICASRNGIQYTLQNECRLKSLTCTNTRSDWKFVGKGICEGHSKQRIKDKYEFIKPGFPFKSNYK